MHRAIHAAAAILLLGIVILVIAARPGQDCVRAVDEPVEVTLDRRIGGAVCGYAGQSIDAEYHKSVYEGSDGCRYSITDKRVIRRKDTGMEDVYFYADVGESDAVRGRVEVMEDRGLHCLYEEEPKARADYVTGDPRVFVGAIHLHHNFIRKGI